MDFPIIVVYSYFYFIIFHLICIVFNKYYIRKAVVCCEYSFSRPSLLIITISTRL